MKYKKAFALSDVDIPEYVMPKCLESLNDKVKEKGIAILKKPREKL
jgi:hypothetical protein